MSVILLARMRRFFLFLAILFAAFHTAYAQWEMEESHTIANLRGICSAGNAVAWASGAGGTVLRTEDSGNLWQSCTVPPGAEQLDFRAIQSFDKNTAVIMSSGKGDLSRLYETTDGCRTWKLLATNAEKDGFWDALSMPRPNRGWILGDPVHGLFTLLTLQTQELCMGAGKERNCAISAALVDATGASVEADSSEQGAFAASNSSIFALRDQEWFGTGGKAGAYVYTRNIRRTRSWSNAAVPVGTGTESSGIFSLQFIRQRKADSLLGMAVGGDYLKPSATEKTAAYSTDSGRTWQPTRTPPHGYRSAVAYDAPHNTWITVGPNGTDVSDDDGRNWQPLKPGPQDAPDADHQWNALSLPFVVGPSGRIGKLRTDR